MIDYNARLSAAILGVGFALVQMQPAQSLTKVEVGKVAQSITVMIQSAQNPRDAGSGIIIKREGETYTVLTAHHVVQNSPNYKVMTPDKKMNPIVQGSIKPLPGVDLALVQFKSGGSYGVAKMGDSTQNPSGSASFVSGFPASNVNAVMSAEYYFTSGEIVANASRPNKEGYALAYSNATFPGMSGGPVLNEQGELIGIHGRGERAERLQDSQVRNDVAVLKTEFNYAIPINTFLTLAPQVNKTLALKTPSPSVSSAPKADDFFLQGDEKYKTGDLKGAVENYSQALRLNPNYGEAYFGRGDARGDLGDKQGAIEDLTQAIRINPNQLRSYGSRGVFRSLSGDQEGAKADFQKALKISINAEDYRDYIGRGVAYVGLGDHKSAIADYDKAIRLAPNYALAYANRGSTRNALGDNKGAIADLDQAIRLNPKYAPAYGLRGTARMALGDNKGGIADFDQVIRLDPKVAPAYASRGNARIALGDNKGAIADFEQAIRIDPKFAPAYGVRGTARIALGDIKGGIADFEQAISLDPKLAVAYMNRGAARYGLGDKQGANLDFQKAATLFKTQGYDKGYQDALNWLKSVNGR
jgi:tetratricopeptide (TPR) repeat protein